MSPLRKQLILSGLFCAVMITVSGCGGGESPPEAGVLSPTNKQTPGESIVTKSGKPAGAAGAAAAKK